MKRFYDVLGLPMTATKEEIQARYRELLSACSNLGANESARVSSVVQESYFTIMYSMQEQQQETPKFALQREPIKAKLTAPLNFNGLKRIGVGIMAAFMLFAMSGCDKLSKEVGNYKEGYTYEDGENKLSIIEDTDKYYLVRLDGHIYLTKAISTENYNARGLTVIRLYDISMSGKKAISVGTILEINGNRIKNGTENVNQTLFDYDFFSGQYGVTKILPAGSCVKLSNFVFSDKPSKEDLAFWDRNTEEVQEAFEQLVIDDLINSVEYNNSKDTITHDFINSVKCYKCTTKEGEVITLVGYRASTCETDIGYNYIYNIFDGSINYIGKNSADAFVSVEEESVEKGKTISELRKIYGIEFTYEATDPIETIETPPVSASPEGSTEPVETGNPVVSEDPVGDVKSVKVDEYKDIWVIDMSAFILNDEYNKVNPDLNVIIINKEVSFIRDFWNVIDGGTEGYQQILIDAYNGNIGYLGEYGDFMNGYAADGTYALNGVKTLDLYLKENGREEDVKEKYTSEDLIKLFAEFNPKLMESIDRSNVIVVDTKALDADLPRYCVMTKSDTTYRDINNASRMLIGTEIVSLYEFDTRISKNVVERSSCVYSLDEFIEKHGLESLLSETITKVDLYEFFNMINGIKKDLSTEKTIN